MKVETSDMNKLNDVIRNPQSAILNGQFRIPHSAFRIFFLALALGVSLVGCRRMSKPEPEAPRPPDYLKINATGNPALGAVTTATATLTFGGVMKGPLQISALVPQDAQIADPAQRLLMARAEGRRKALRQLGQTIMEVRDTQGASFGEALKKSPTDQSKLEKLLEEKARVTFREEAVGVRATAVIEGREVMETLGLVAPAAPQGAAANLSLKDRQEMAYNLALEEARGKLREALLEMMLPDGRTVRQALAEDAAAATDFSAMLWVLQPDEARYLPDGGCEVTIIFR